MSRQQRQEAAVKSGLIAIILALVIILAGMLTDDPEPPDRACYAILEQCAHIRTTLDNR